MSGLGEMIARWEVKETSVLGAEKEGISALLIQNYDTGDFGVTELQRAR